ncbi:MAG: division/cell wall cluster transcriptional repressor MraZ [Proteobacteria bacterium]|nr:division/cell wall cluster transcriptional repressor MraZ [Pseudomonadota bacterium]
MTNFLGSHLNRLDAKGRVSVPAMFRSSLRALAPNPEGSVTMILRPSHTRPCIEAWPQMMFDRLAQSLNRYDLFSPEYEDMSTAIYGNAYPTEADKEGRIVLNEMMVAHAGLTDNVVFMGTGPIFQIWEPAAAKLRAEEARQNASARGLTLPGGPRLPSAATASPPIAHTEMAPPAGPAPTGSAAS